ncbi:osmoprotectant uptake system permease [Deinococcus malanensis]|uniref:Osmoprotectant uptake system permease n=1 Tax=Deinococcus malanensis TaxID=1706855 RepID=A0ABQ2F0I7_9DEIO|nr:ABC transporter permease [Deinococcus malanensis]GGK31107.1 osmoprotectant uptake system permease [Deinococcus malanensis]
MTALSTEAVLSEKRKQPARPDIRVVLWLGAVPMLAGALLPWVLLRPNRLAPGELLRVPGAITLALLVLAVLPALLIRRLPGVAAAAAAAGLLAAFWLLGERTAGALTGQAEFARASAASGFWLYMVGALIAASSAAQAGRGARRWAWAWVPGAAVLLLSGQLSSWSVLVEARSEGPRWVQEFGQHLRLVGSALGLAVLLGVPLTLWAARRERVAGGLLGLANAVQTIPSLALLGLLIVPLAALSRAFPALREVGVAGIGVAPALSAMTLYALLPVLRNGIEALRGVPPGVVDAARGMGMTSGQTFWRVELPLAMPVWLSGVRQAAVMLVGVAAVAALIGAGGLGTYIFKGLQSAATDLILLGAVPAVLLAIFVDALLRATEGWLGGRLGQVEDA